MGYETGGPSAGRILCIGNAYETIYIWNINIQSGKLCVGNTGEYQIPENSLWF